MSTVEQAVAALCVCGHAYEYHRDSHDNPDLCWGDIEGYLPGTIALYSCDCDFYDPEAPAPTPGAQEGGDT